MSTLLCYEHLVYSIILLFLVVLGVELKGLNLGFVRQVLCCLSHASNPVFNYSCCYIVLSIGLRDIKNGLFIKLGHYDIDV
jgi:hypothetical protein